MTRDICVMMIGCGAFARLYHVPALMADPGVRIAGIFDPHPVDEVRALAARCGAPVAARLGELPKTDGATAAIVTTPHALHADHVAHALDRGWHVLCDKPFVMRLDEARRLAAQAERAGRLNAVGFNRRFDRACLRARELIRAGAIGTVRFVETVQLGYPSGGWYCDPALGGGGPFTGRGTHMADLTPWLLDALPVRVKASLRAGGAGRIDGGGTIDVDFGQVHARLTCVAEGWYNWDEVRVFGDGGLIEMRRPMGQPIGWTLRLDAAARERLEAEPDFGAATVDFLAALRGGGRPRCSFADAAPSVAIIEQAYASARGGEDWRALPAL